MPRKYRAVILFYPTGIVHMRNLELLKKHFRDFRFKVVVEPWMEENAPEVLETVKPKNRVLVTGNRLPAELWEEPVDALFLSMAYPTPFRLHMVHQAASRDIPIVAIEEVNQLALNDGIINHYFLPVDFLGVPSEIERERFMELGVPGSAVETTGWPFFDPAEIVLKHHHNVFWKEKYNISAHHDICLLVLGSLKEHDIVSLETRRVRQEILQIVSSGLPDQFQLVIKPHPIETPEGIEDIKKMAPNAIVIDSKHPIEPLLLQSQVIVNRGNSQVTLLAMLQDKPVIAVPVGLNTIFHGVLDQAIAYTIDQFQLIMEKYMAGAKPNYKEILQLHFPYSHEKAFQKVGELLETALQKGAAENGRKKAVIAIIYAFLGELQEARTVVGQLTDTDTAQLLIKLFKKQITTGEFGQLLESVPGKIPRWHLQALYIRQLIENRRGLHEAIRMLDDFDGDVNPHYFIHEILARVELEYKACRPGAAQFLVEKFKDDYAVFKYYRQGFDMMEYAYGRRGGQRLRKTVWLMKNCRKAYTRKYIKDKIIKKR